MLGRVATSAADRVPGGTLRSALASGVDWAALGALDETAGVADRGTTTDTSPGGIVAAVASSDENASVHVLRTPGDA